MSNTGIPTNAGQVYDAVLFKGENSNVVYGDEYQKGNAVQAKAPGMVLMDTKVLPVGTIQGWNSIFINWKSTNTTDYLLRVEIYAGSDEIGWDIAFQCESSEFNYGNEIIYDFDPYETYRIIITSLTSEEIFLDYIEFTPIFPGTIISGIRETLYGEECLQVLDRGRGTVTGNGTPSVSATVPFNVTYDEAPDVYTTVYNNSLKADPTTVSLSDFALSVAHIHNTNWSSTQNVSWMAIGKVLLPFSPGIPSI